MAWEGTREQNRLLWQALDEALNVQGYPKQRLAAAINSDPLAQESAKAWGNRAGDVIDDGTLGRWHKGGVDAVEKARSFKKLPIYEFFERTSSPRTNLYRPSDGLPAGLSAFAAQFSERIKEPFADDLSYLDGIYRVFRPAWTIPKISHERVMISRLKIETSGGFTRFTEHQDYQDPDSLGILVDQTDNGAVLSMSGNFVFFGIGRDGHGCKIYAAWNFYPLPRKGVKVRTLTGNMMGINGNGPHPSYPFVASRTEENWDDIEMGIFRPPHKRLSPDILDALDIRSSESMKISDFDGSKQ